MKGTAIVVGASLIAALIASTESPTPESPAKVETNSARELQSYFDSLASDNKFSGVLLIAKNGVTVASKAAGIANKANGAAIDLDTKFNLGSMNKMFTAVAIAQLAQARKLSFNDTVGKHLADYPNKDVSEKVTIHQLLTHTSGMGMYWNDKFMAEREKLLVANKPALQKFLAAIGKASDWIRQHPDEAIPACQETGSSLAGCKTAISVAIAAKNPYTWSSTTWVNTKGIEAMLPIVAKVVPKASEMKVSDLVDTSVAASGS